jgi:hypothetical protein
MSPERRDSYASISSGSAGLQYADFCTSFIYDF